MKLLNEIQQKLKAPKGQMNKFGGYKYRSCEDILEAVKPLLGTGVLKLEDEIVLIGDRYYIKATATLKDDNEFESASAYARESLSKKGMDESQITGTASSYARKYALNGLFCIDDTKDADTDEHANEQNKPDETPKPDPDIVDKLVILLEENLDGKKVSKDKLINLMYVRFRRFPSTDEEAQKLANWMVEKDMLNSITE